MPLPRDGEPYPDQEAHGGARPRYPRDYRSGGIDAARILDEYFARPGAHPRELEAAFHDVHVPIHPSEHITAAAWRADRQRVRDTGRWLVRRSRDRCSVAVGLALLASGLDEEDIPLIQTIGLLSDMFSPLAARALERQSSGAAALLWLGDRVEGWGRVYVAEALCRCGTPEVRAWLLRRACTGDYLDAYFAGKIATQAHLDEAITAAGADDELVDHTGLILIAMRESGPTPRTLANYPPARKVLEAHAGHARRQAPTRTRFFRLGVIARYLLSKQADQLPWDPGQRERVLDAYLSLLNMDEWCTVARDALAAGDKPIAWLASTKASGQRLRAFRSPGEATG